MAKKARKKGALVFEPAKWSVEFMTNHFPSAKSYSQDAIVTLSTFSESLAIYFSSTGNTSLTATSPTRFQLNLPLERFEPFFSILNAVAEKSRPVVVVQRINSPNDYIIRVSSTGTIPF